MAAEQFGPYRLDELIGLGGMGEVYRAYDTTKDRTVALKRLPRHLADDSGFQSQFRRESQIVARLREPHIIPIHDFGEIDGMLFIDMRLVDGVNLASLLEQRGPLPPARAVAIVLQVAGALAAAHAEHLVHRDVKPANVLVTGADQGEDHVYLADFGIARDTSATEFGPAGAMVGSAEYMAPEQFTEGRADHRADLYALGGLLHTALTARRPFAVDGPAAQMHAHLQSPPPAPSAQVPGLPPALDLVVATAMAKSPDRRHQSAAAFATALRAALTGTNPESGANPEPAPQWTALTRPFGVDPMRMLGWRTDPLDISLAVAEQVSKKTVSAVSDMFRSRLKSAMTTLRNVSPDEPADDTVVMKTVFEEGANRTVIEVRIPLTAVQESDLDLDHLLSDAYAAANAQARGDLRGKHVTVDAADPAHGPALVTVTDDEPVAAPPEPDRRSP